MYVEHDVTAYGLIRATYVNMILEHVVLVDYLQARVSMTVMSTKNIM